MPGPLTFNINAARAQAGLADTMNAFRPQAPQPSQAMPGFQPPQMPQPQQTGAQVNPFSAMPGGFSPQTHPSWQQPPLPPPQMQPQMQPQTQPQTRPMQPPQPLPATYQSQMPAMGQPRGLLQPQAPFGARALQQLFQSGQAGPQALQQLMARYR